MLKTTIFLLFLILLQGCGSSSSDGTDTTFIPSDNTPDDTTQVTQTTVSRSSIPMLAVLVSFNNIQISSSLTTWSDKLFGKNEGQLNHYYIQASNANFEFSPVEDSNGLVSNGTVEVIFNTNHPDTDIDSYLFDSAVHPYLANSLRIIDRDTDIDFSNYDTDANGVITPDELLLTFIIAGYEDSYEGSHVRNGVWAHQSCVSDTSNIPILDGVKLMSCAGGGNFALFGERHGTVNTHDATIGIIAHELGHSAFNLPDLYNTANQYSGGIGVFGLMGAGTWTYKEGDIYPGATPTHFSAWSKVYNRWITPKEFTSSSSTTLSATSSMDYDIIKIPINSTSYYLLENRNNSGYDQGLYTLDGNFRGGIAIWKIDETKLTELNFFNNSVNADTYNKGVDLVEAVAGDIDSAAGYGDENALYYSGNKNYFLNLVSDISAPGSVMNLTVN